MTETGNVTVNLLPEPRHQFDMRSMAKLVDRRHAFDGVAAIDRKSVV